MAKEKLKWKAWSSYEYAGLPKLEFFGREPFSVPNAEHRKQWMNLTGVFEELEGGMLRYCGKASFELKDGSRCQIDKEGYIDVEKTNVSNKLLTEFE